MAEEPLLPLEPSDREVLRALAVVFWPEIEVSATMAAEAFTDEMIAYRDGQRVLTDEALEAWRAAVAALEAEREDRESQ